MNDVVTNAALITQPCKGHPWPALHAAIERGQLEVVRLSLDWGSDPWRTTFVAAEALGDQQMVAF